MTERQLEMREKFMAFAVRIVNLNKYLSEQKHEFSMSKQIQRSGTAIGALQREAHYAESNVDMIHKLRIALKEANETGFWLELLCRTEYITKAEYESLNNELVELCKILVPSIATLTKRNVDKNSAD